MKLKPFGSLILIKIHPEDNEPTTTGGIVMPSTIDNSRTPRICSIVAVGQDVRNIPLGTKVLIPRDAAAMPLDNIIPPDEEGSVYALVQPVTIIATLSE
tara:strand:- start:136 stop:432 length:297 start_codon:yes stop_codon:yes gene_type:complete